jgi:Spy/CpxP family protein refolding chaperone
MEDSMTRTVKTLALSGGAAALLVVGMAGGFVSAQDQTGPRGQREAMRDQRSTGDQRGRMGRGGPRGLMGPLAGLPLGRLELTDAQREQVRTILDSHREDSLALRKRATEARQALDAAITAGAYDEATVRARSADVATVEADVAVQRARVYQEVFRILTTQQQEEAKKIQAQMRQRMESSGARRGR